MPEYVKLAANRVRFVKTVAFTFRFRFVCFQSFYSYSTPSYWPYLLHKGHKRGELHRKRIHLKTIQHLY